MKKSKSFKSLSDLKDVDLFRSSEKVVGSDVKNSAKTSTEVIASHPLTTKPITIEKEPVFQDTILGTVEQEDSYQQRVRWISRREEEVSVGESSLILSKRALEAEKNELTKAREKLAAEFRTHERQLEKLNQLDAIAAELNAKRANLHAKEVSLTTKSVLLESKERDIKKELTLSKKAEQHAIKENISLSMALERQGKKLKEVLLESQKTIKIIELQKQDVKEAKKEISQLQKQINLLEQKAQEVSGGVKIKLDNWDFVEFLIKNGSTAAQLGYAGKKIAICGDGPWVRKDFETILKLKGFIPVDAPNNQAEIAIIGRDFDEQEVEGQLIARQHKQIHFYSQELLISSIAAKQNPLNSPESYEDLLNEFSQDHPGLLFLMENFEFPWPLANISDSVALVFASDGLVDQSPLVSVGYRVGVERGLDQDSRRNILSNSFAGTYDHLKRWYVDSDEYMARWGKPNSRRRLFQMSHHIHALILNRRSNPSMKYAVQDWKDDLVWLKKFYKPYMSFKWPILK
ncbi:hypothetical protein M2125_000976 [Polynucleobacter sphagniphilus]|uniref:hypothetical protein n=1 Tax=Polynucleobacter sphagniphilus TaxID=1743169 RepID=UPI00247329BE|nr:hypothetical protein [Polynucleobacter sphagniphilus]MDH6241169.1 hypothetical protein [Polynucleobacter sphagniphilus]